MATTTAIPVTVTPEAAARIAALGVQREFDLMLDHARQIVPRLTAITVALVERYDLGDEPGIDIEAWIEGPYQPEDRFVDQWDRWAIATFPPDVHRHFILSPLWA